MYLNSFMIFFKFWFTVLTYLGPPSSDFFIFRVFATHWKISRNVVLKFSDFGDFGWLWHYPDIFDASRDFVKFCRSHCWGQWWIFWPKSLISLFRSPPSSDFDTLINVDKWREMSKNVKFCQFCRSRCCSPTSSDFDASRSREMSRNVEFCQILSKSL